MNFKYMCHILGVLVVINISVLYVAHKTVADMKQQISTYAEQANTKLSKLDELAINLQAIKDVVGWKTTEISPTDCMATKYLTNDPFSVVTKGDKCYLHEFDKFNRLVKSLNVIYADGGFSNVINEIKQEAKDIIYQVKPDTNITIQTK